MSLLYGIKGSVEFGVGFGFSVIRLLPPIIPQVDLTYIL